MGKGRDRSARRRANADRSPPIPLEPVDLLAGLAPGVTLTADDRPAGIPDNDDAAPATASVAETGKLVRAGDGTVRRLVRGQVIAPPESPVDVDDVLRAGVPPRTPDKPGE